MFDGRRSVGTFHVDEGKRFLSYGWVQRGAQVQVDNGGVHFIDCSAISLSGVDNRAASRSAYEALGIQPTALQKRRFTASWRETLQWVEEAKGVMSVSGADQAWLTFRRHFPDPPAAAPPVRPPSPRRDQPSSPEGISENDLEELLVDVFDVVDDDGVSWDHLVSASMDAPVEDDTMEAWVQRLEVMRTAGCSDQSLNTAFEALEMLRIGLPKPDPGYVESVAVEEIILFAYTGVRLVIQAARSLGRAALRTFAQRAERAAERAALTKAAQRARVGSALKEDAYHRAVSFIMPQMIRNGKHFIFRSGDGTLKRLTQMLGEVNGKKGVFEVIVGRNGQIEHQMFRVGGAITGKPQGYGRTLTPVVTELH
ncbi:unnamed protein product [Symbiodinium natans]|uniref:Uncharacterized protein n=1 Tax=Symbiodinium natans TaxID=878477 RepID=A0A812STM5_9DINO|nr:unnamed protein product [Symbiodinium natans]